MLFFFFCHSEFNLRKKLTMLIIHYYYYFLCILSPIQISLHPQSPVISYCHLHARTVRSSCVHLHPSKCFLFLFSYFSNVPLVLLSIDTPSQPIPMLYVASGIGGTVGPLWSLNWLCCVGHLPPLLLETPSTFIIPAPSQASFLYGIYEGFGQPVVAPLFEEGAWSIQDSWCLKLSRFFLEDIFRSGRPRSSCQESSLPNIPFRSESKNRWRDSAGGKGHGGYCGGMRETNKLPPRWVCATPDAGKC